MGVTTELGVTTAEGEAGFEGPTDGVVMEGVLLFTIGVFKGKKYRKGLLKNPFIVFDKALSPFLNLVQKDNDALEAFLEPERAGIQLYLNNQRITI